MNSPPNPNLLIPISQVLVLRLDPSSEDDRVNTVSLFTYFHSRRRCGVLAQMSASLKDVYIVPVARQESLPAALAALRLPGPGLAEGDRGDLLLAVLIRQVRKRAPDRHHDSGGGLLPPAGREKRRALADMGETSPMDETSVLSPVMATSPNYPGHVFPFQGGHDAPYIPGGRDNDAPYIPGGRDFAPYIPGGRDDDAPYIPGGGSTLHPAPCGISHDLLPRPPSRDIPRVPALMAADWLLGTATPADLPSCRCHPRGGCAVRSRAAVPHTARRRQQPERNCWPRPPGGPGLWPAQGHPRHAAQRGGHRRESRCRSRATAQCLPVGRPTTFTVWPPAATSGERSTAAATLVACGTAARRPRHWQRPAVPRRLGSTTIEPRVSAIPSRRAAHAAPF